MEASGTSGTGGSSGSSGSVPEVMYEIRDLPVPPGKGLFVRQRIPAKHANHLREASSLATPSGRKDSRESQHLRDTFAKVATKNQSVLTARVAGLNQADRDKSLSLPTLMAFSVTQEQHVAIYEYGSINVGVPNTLCLFPTCTIQHV